MKDRADEIAEEHTSHELECSICKVSKAERCDCQYQEDVVALAAEIRAYGDERAKWGKAWKAECKALWAAFTKGYARFSGSREIGNLWGAHEALASERKAREGAEEKAHERLLTANAWQEQARHLEAKLEHTETILAAAIQRAEQAEDRASSAESELAMKDGALRVASEALDQTWAGVGDRLLAKGPLSKEYAHKVMLDLKMARNIAREALKP